LIRGRYATLKESNTRWAVNYRSRSEGQYYMNYARILDIQTLYPLKTEDEKDFYVLINDEIVAAKFGIHGRGIRDSECIMAMSIDKSDIEHSEVDQGDKEARAYFRKEKRIEGRKEREEPREYRSE
jgi:hypothetical protein